MPLHPGVYCYLLETRPLVAAACAGFAVALDRQLVQQTLEGNGAWAQALGIPVAIIAGHEHRLDCTILRDGWELVYCRGCGEEW